MKIFASRIEFAFATLFVFALHAPLLGQSVSPGGPPQTFHVHGTVTDPLGAVITDVKVVFQSKQISQTLDTDRKGFYELDLPFGDYVMAVTAPRGFVPYQRPLFRVTSQVSLVFTHRWRLREVATQLWSA